MERLGAALEIAALTFVTGSLLSGLVGVIVIVIKRITSGQEAGESQ